MNNHETRGTERKTESKTIIVLLVVLLILVVAGLAVIVSQGASSFLNTKLVPDAVDNSQARGLEDYRVSANMDKLEQYGSVNHGYVSQEISTSVEGKYDTFITFKYDCEVDYYSRPDNDKKMDVPDDAKIEILELSVYADKFDMEEMINYIKETMKTVTDVEVNDTYLRSLFVDANNSLCTCKIEDNNHEMFDIHYSVEVNDYVGYIIKVGIDFKKNW